MITRIVRMEFEADKLQTFLTVFDASKLHIRAFDGCEHLELHKDPHNPNVRYTFSLWQSEDDLNAYRHSPLFKATWAKTKILFAAKPLAYSLIKEEVVPQK